MAKYLLSVLLVCFFIARLQSFDCIFNPTHLVKHGHELKGLAFWESRTKGIVECAQSCIRRKKCKSFNFNKNSGLCRLNANIGQPTSTADIGWVYSEIGDWPSQVDPHCYNNSCGEDEICIPGNSNDAQNCAHSCFNLARACPLPVVASPNQPRTVGSVFNHTCADGLGEQFIAVCLEDGQWNETIENVCKLCDDGWTQFKDKCYFFGGPPSQYNDAKIFCEKKNSSLVQAETEEENEFVKTQLRSRDTESSLCKDGNGMCCFWNALYQYSDDGNETWTPDGQALTYTSWNIGEPNNDALERCTVYVCYNNFYWSDVECDRRLFQPICEK